MKIASAIVVGLEIAGAFESKPRFCRRRKIGSTTEKPRQTGRDRIQNSSRGVPSGDAVGIGGKDWDVFVPALGKIAPLHPFALIGKFWMGAPVALEQRQPFSPQLLAANAEFLREMIVDTVRHQEFCILGPPVRPLGEPYLLLTQRFAVRARGVLLVRRTIADVALDNDQARPIVDALGDRDRVGDPLTIVGVADPLHVPAIGE